MISLPIWLFIILLACAILFFITIVLLVAIVCKFNEKMDREYTKYMNEIYYRKGGNYDESK